MERYLHFIAESTWQSPKQFNLPEGVEASFWSPSFGSWSAPGLGKSGIVFSLFHLFGLFSNAGYGVFIYRHDGKIIHRSMVSPRYFRFPNMDAEDIQIGATWTDPDWRGKGLALSAILEIVNGKKSSRTNVWYIVEQENEASIRVIEKAQFKLKGTGLRKKRFGLGVLGYFDLETADDV